MNRYVLASILVALLVIVSITPAMAASDITVRVTVIGPDGDPLKNVKVMLYDDTGAKVDEDATDENGTAVLTVTANETYLIVVKGEYYILDTVTVSGDTNKTVDASVMHLANLTSEPKNVDVKVVLVAFEDVTLTMTTNITVYSPSDINVTYPKEVVEVPYKYVLDKIEYDGKETNKTTITLDMAEDYKVVAHYTKTFYLTLEYWLLVVLVLIIIVALAVAWTAGSRTAKTVIEEYREKNRKFVKKK